MNGKMILKIVKQMRLCICRSVKTGGELYLHAGKMHMIISSVHFRIFFSVCGLGTCTSQAREVFSEEVLTPLPQRLAVSLCSVARRAHIHPPLVCLPYPALRPHELLQTLQALSCLLSLHMLFPPINQPSLPFHSPSGPSPKPPLGER